VTLPARTLLTARTPASSLSNTGNTYRLPSFSYATPRDLPALGGLVDPDAAAHCRQRRHTPAVLEGLTVTSWYSRMSKGDPLGTVLTALAGIDVGDPGRRRCS
jgi:hypothetical protein